jgi:pilus assembly protein CpaB
MKARTILTLTVSLGMAGLAAMMANTWITQRLGAAEQKEQTDQVVAAAADIPVGTKLAATHLKMIALPQESITEANYTQIEDVLGRVVTQPLYAGEILVEKRLTEHADGSPLAAVIEKGKRALTVRVNDVIGVAGFLLPSSRVDVVSTKRAAGGRSTESKTIVENLKVLAVDQTVNSDKNEPVVVRAVTLEVSPKQAEQIVKATEEGKVQLTLRNPLDLAKQVQLPKTKQVDKPEPVVAKTVSRGWSQYRVDVIRGTERSNTVVAN